MTTIYYEVLKTAKQKIVKIAFIILLFLNVTCTFYGLFRQDEYGVSKTDMNSAAKETQNMSLEEAFKFYESETKRYTEKIIQNKESVSETSYKYFRAQQNEYQRVAKLFMYDDLIGEIKDNLYSMRNVGIFGAQNSYSQRLADFIYKEYDQLDVEITAADAPYGIDVMVNNEYSRLLSLAGVFTLCFMICRCDYENQMGKLLFTQKRSVRKMGIDKVGSIFFFTVLIETYIYLSNFAVAAYIGIGDASRPIQTITGFYESTLEISVGEYLIIYFLLHMMADLIFAMICFFIFNIIRSEKIAALLSVIVVVAETALYYGTDQMWLKYINLCSLCNPTSYLGEAKGIRFISIPIPLKTAVIVCGLIILVLFVVFGVFTFQKNIKHMLSSDVAARRRVIKKNVVLGSVTAYELKKLFIYSGGLIVLTIFAAMQSFLWINKSHYVYPYEYYYNEYIEQFGGEATSEKKSKMEEEYQKTDYTEFQNELIQKLESGQITEQYFNYAISDFSENSYKLEALKALMQQYDLVEELNSRGYETTIINTIPWNNLLGSAGLLQNMIIWIETLIVSTFLFSIYGVFEKRNGMDVIISVSKIGKKEVFRRKMIPVVFSSVLLSVAGALPRILYLVNHYDYSSYWQTVSSWKLIDVPDVYRMYGMCASVAVIYLAANIIISYLCFKIAGKMKGISSALMINSLKFVSIPLIMLVIATN